MEVPASLTDSTDAVIATLPTVGLTVGLGVAFYAVIVWLGERADRRAMDRLIDAEARLERWQPPAWIAPGTDLSFLPAWTCFNCEQLNAGWTRECGRCEPHPTDGSNHQL